MRFVGITFHNCSNSSDVKGYLKVPDTFDGSWTIGYRQYLIDTYNAKDIKMYPLDVRLNSDSVAYNINGFENMEDSFILALRSNKYYPSNPENDSIRIAWSKLDPATQSFTVKER